MLIKYIRTPKKIKSEIVYMPDGTPTACLKEYGGEPVGVIVSTERNKLGWSLCSKKDRFNKEMGKRIAINRADYYGTNKANVLEEAPNSIREELLKMYDRSNKYYK